MVRINHKQKKKTHTHTHTQCNKTNTVCQEVAITRVDKRSPTTNPTAKAMALPSVHKTGLITSKNTFGERKTRKTPHWHYAPRENTALRQASHERESTIDRQRARASRRKQQLHANTIQKHTICTVASAYTSNSQFAFRSVCVRN